MPIISWQFALFTVVVLLLYYLLPRKAQNVWLLAASLGYLATWNTWSVGVLLAATLINYIAGRNIWKNGLRNRSWLWLGIAANLLALFLFRVEASGYLDRLIWAVTGLVNSSSSFEWNILIPVGFSYYCLQAISYLVDVSQKQCQPEEDLVDFGLYMAYFPRLLSGPIERARNFLPALKANRVVDNERISNGFTRIIIGLVRKLVIAGILTEYLPKDMFSAPMNYSGLDLVLKVFIYAFWVYNDFAGYTSIVRGISDLLGIDLSPNFSTPYFARSFTDFWNRWHISLSHWLRDYIFFPFSRYLLRKKVNPRTALYLAIPPLLTMLVSGLWHNFGAYMIFWGLLHGVFQALEKLAARGKPAVRWEDRSTAGKVGSMLLVFAGVLLTWIPFASGSLYRVWDYARAVFSSTVKPVASTLWLIPVFAITIHMALDLLEYRQNSDLAVTKLKPGVQATLLAAALLAIGISFLGGSSALASFVYQAF